MNYISLFSGIAGFEKGIERAFAKHNENLQNLLPPREREYEGTDSTGGQGRLDAQSATGLGNSLSGDGNDENYQLHARQNRQSNQSEFEGNGEHSEMSGRKYKPICIGFSEIDRRAIEIYRYHYPNHKNYGSATDIICDELPDFDLLVGGFPCQAFSIAGKRQGFEDVRGTLFFEIARILEAKKPRNFLLENVGGLFSHDEGRTFDTIRRTLTDIGYFLEWDYLNSKNYGVPQNRERVFLVGYFGKIPEREVFLMSDTSRYRALGNAVTCNVIEAIISKMIEAGRFE